MGLRHRRHGIGGAAIEAYARSAPGAGWERASFFGEGFEKSKCKGRVREEEFGS